MKIGVLSDIHSNIIAWEACVAYLEDAGCDSYLLLGDYVSDTPRTRETMEALYTFIETHDCQLLRGNREEYMLSQREARRQGRTQEQWLWNSASGNLLFTYEQLTERDFAFFEALPIAFRFEQEGLPAITCCHGSPASARELLQLHADNTKGWLERIDTAYLLCAHTHFPGQFSHRGKRYLNTGCVGVAIGDAGFAQCMMLEDTVVDGQAQWKPTFLKIPYDNRQVVREICESGLLAKAPWFINSNIQILLTGVDHSAELVALAQTLSEQAGERTVWPHIKETYFAQAAARLGVPDYRACQPYS